MIRPGDGKPVKTRRRRISEVEVLVQRQECLEPEIYVESLNNWPDPPVRRRRRSWKAKRRFGFRIAFTLAIGGIVAALYAPTPGVKTTSIYDTNAAILSANDPNDAMASTILAGDLMPRENDVVAEATAQPVAR